MKKLFTSLVAMMLFVSITNAQEAPAPVAQPDGSKIKFLESEFTFPEGPVGTPVTHEFVFVNEGTAPLTIETARASCGCTTPKWTTEQVLPGQKGSVSATYNMGHAGSFNKSVTITTKGAETVVVYIKGNAIDPNPVIPVTVSDGPVPVQAPIVAPVPVEVNKQQAPQVISAPVVEKVVEAAAVVEEKVMTKKEKKAAKKASKQ